MAKIPCIIQHKQLLSTKFGRILWYWTDDINHAAKWTEDLATSLICFGSEYKLAEHFTHFTANCCLKQEKQGENSVNRSHLLFGVYMYLQTWTALYLLNFPIKMHYQDELDIDGGKHVLACFKTRNYCEWIIKQLLNSAFLSSEELWRS